MNAASQATLRWRAKNRVHYDAYQREYGRRYRAEHHDEMKQYQREWRAKNRGALAVADRERGLRRLYDISSLEYDAMLRQQGGRCAICKTNTPGGQGKRLHVDHDHRTGHVRGLLCQRCNTALGWFEKNSQGVSAYLADRVTT